ncbi:MAG: PadR family transcriptional regulator [Cyclobacteriaceae bacterium]
MKGTNLGEFEELLLLVVASLYPDAYGVAIREEIITSTGRAAALGAIHAGLGRLEEKGFLKSDLDSATPARGGRRKRLFAITAAGKKALELNRDLRNQLWDKIPELSWKNVQLGGF